MAMTKKEQKEAELRFLKLLSHNFPDVATASTEIINLSAILNLPKGTEHFLADLHGEYKAFQHVLRNASGTIKRKVGEIFNDTLSNRDKKDLCTLIYYPERKLELVNQVADGDDEVVGATCADDSLYNHIDVGLLVAVGSILMKQLLNYVGEAAGQCLVDL